MKSLLAISALLAAAFAASLPSSPSLGSEYNGYKVVRIPTAKENHAKVVSLINELKLNTWKFPSKVGAAADVVVSPAQLSAFEKATAGLTLETMHEDLGASIDAESATVSAYEAGSANSTWFNSYHSYDDHLQFLRDLQAQHPSNSEIITSGNSYERRAIQGIHIWGSAGKGKPAIVWHGTIHAREWITTMPRFSLQRRCSSDLLLTGCFQVVEYLTYNLLTQRNAPDVKSFLDKYDFFIFPITNPDGRSIGDL
ncbi:hypothetical protein PRK78_004138 [Emydomyces testavorans]|uniref:Peptidase M14 domain-containing protein n=1 Tax=Emydomyces testavorans TaxID=2070801 RepID=A0AAF0DKM3_9EURO|nr:hypothetical protein PRK78_004138 [Emydomyces testavorans]